MTDQDKANAGPPIMWSGPVEGIENWKEYKRAKAMRFVQLGYSVQWSPDVSNHMEVSTPQQDDAGHPGIRASVIFLPEPSRMGINGGRILKLHIQIRQVSRDVQGRPIVSWNMVYFYESRPDVNKLSDNPMAQSLFETVVSELN